MKVKTMVQNMVYLGDQQENHAKIILRYMEQNGIPFIQKKESKSSAVNYAIREFAKAIREGHYVDTDTLAAMVGDYAQTLALPTRQIYSVWYNEDVQEDIATIGLHLELREDYKVRWLKRTKNRSYNRNMIAVFAMQWLVKRIHGS